MLPARLLFLIFSDQVQPILVEKNGSNKRIECLSNDSTVLISVLFYICAKSSILSFTAISLSCISVVLFDFNSILPLWIIFSILRSSQMNKVNQLKS